MWLVILSLFIFVFFFKQKTAYEMRISDWSSDVCSSDLGLLLAEVGRLNNISVSQDDLGRALRAEASRYPGQEERVLQFYRETPGAMARLQAPILEENVVDYIHELAKVTQKTVTAEELWKEAEDTDSGNAPRPEFTDTLPPPTETAT